MLYYDRFDVSKDTDVNKQANQNSAFMNLSNIAILNIKW